VDGRDQGRRMTAVGQFYAFDPRRRIGRSADKSGHLLVRLLRLAAGCPASHEAGQFMSDNRKLSDVNHRRIGRDN